MKLPENAPLLVKFTMIGLKTRKQVLFFVILSIGITIAAAFLTKFFVAGVFGLAAIFYYYTMRWIDARNGWQTTGT
ncbi:hypothetical protein [Marivivens marinus]|uniref:hypothetical protein n=1 Tax=Marivivens marinus TaxID=3110173 RepID=UPI003B846680